MSLTNDDWDRLIGRQIRLRDLQVLIAVAQHVSMAKAASHLSVTQPAISQSIADLERAVGARLVDRGSRGVQLTTYGEIFLKRGNEAFDSLKQGMRDLESWLSPVRERSRSAQTCPISPAVSSRQLSNVWLSAIRDSRCML